jgi:hypothetical protein
MRSMTTGTRSAQTQPAWTGRLGGKGSGAHGPPGPPWKFMRTQPAWESVGRKSSDHSAAVSVLLTCLFLDCVLAHTGEVPR